MFNLIISDNFVVEDWTATYRLLLRIVLQYRLLRYFTRYCQNMHKYYNAS